MKTFNRITTIVLTVIMLISLTGNLSIFAYKVTEGATAEKGIKGEYSYGSLTYNIIEKEAVIMYSPTSGNVVIPDNINGYRVTEIADYAFYNCEDIVSVTIGNNVRRIGDYAFEHCLNMESLVIGTSVEEIGEYAFHYCSFVDSIALPNGIMRLGYGFLKGTDYYLAAKWTGDALYIDNYLIEVKDTVSGIYEIKAGTTCISDGAFKLCTKLTGIKIPDSVTAIGGFAFDTCTGLTSVTIPDSVKYIHDYAFQNCKNLSSVNMGNSVLEIGYLAFSGTKCLTKENNIYYIGRYLIDTDPAISGKVTVKDGTYAIAERAFCDRVNVTELVLPKSLKSIGSVAFSGMNALDKINIPASVVRMGGDAFIYGKKNLKVYVEDITAWCGISFENRDANPFRKNNSVWVDKNGKTLTELTIPDGVNSIGDYCFYNCDFLKKLTIPDSVTSIGYGCFKECDLNNITLICDEDSYAGKYAKENGITVTPGCKHSFTNYISNNDLSCTTDGTATAICNNGCGKSDTKVTEKAPGHSFGEWLITAEPTYTADGTKMRICSVCQKTETEHIPMLTLSFTDVKDNHWFAESVKYCVQKGYVVGMTETTFVPNGNITRAQFLVMLAKLDGVDLSVYEGKDAGFTDVKPSHWYNTYICWAVEQELTAGLTPTTFGPNTNVTRAQLARFFYVYSEKKGIAVEGRADIFVYPDADKVADWAIDGISWAVDAGIISGVKRDNVNYLDPNGTATRAQATVMFKAFDAFRK